MHFICRSFIGKDNPQFWSQTWENEPDLNPSQSHLFGLISLQTSSSGDLKSIGHNLINQINQSFFAQTEGDINQKLSRLIESHILNNSFPDIEINLSLAIIHQNQLYIGIYGQNQTILQRNSQVSQLLSGVSHQFLQISGPFKNNDRLILSTTKFVNQLGWEKIKSIIIDSKIQNIEESLLADLYSFEDQTQLSAFLIEICPDDNDQSDLTQPSVNSIPNTPISQPLLVTSSPENNPLPPPLFPSNRQPNIYVKSRFKFKIGNHKKIQLGIALFLLLGLIVSSYFGYQKNQTQKAETNFQNLKSELEKKLNNIAVVKNLNLETTYQSAKEAQEIITQMLQLNVHSDEVNQYKSQVDLILSQNGDSDSFQPESVYDTSLITDNPKFSKIFFSKSNQIFIFSIVLMVVLTVLFPKKNPPKIFLSLIR